MGKAGDNLRKTSVVVEAVASYRSAASLDRFVALPPGNRLKEEKHWQVLEILSEVHCRYGDSQQDQWWPGSGSVSVVGADQSSTRPKKHKNMCQRVVRNDCCRPLPSKSGS